MHTVSADLLVLTDLLTPIVDEISTEKYATAISVGRRSIPFIVNIQNHHLAAWSIPYVIRLASPLSAPISGPHDNEKLQRRLALRFRERIFHLTTGDSYFQRETSIGTSPIELLSGRAINKSITPCCSGTTYRHRQSCGILTLYSGDQAEQGRRDQ